jgi:hypothetical protein
MRTTRVLWLVVAAGCFLFRATASATETGIEGAWHAETYYLKAGAQHRVEGLIFFTEKDWTVLFFVMAGDEEPRRGSGEGGIYTLTGDRLVFTHYYHLSTGKAMEGLDESPLRMEVHGADSAQTEPCRVEIETDRMVLHFPSGNRMSFRRSSR